jgi:hypothetical protein
VRVRRRARSNELVANVGSATTVKNVGAWRIAEAIIAVAQRMAFEMTSRRFIAASPA